MMKQEHTVYAEPFDAPVRSVRVVAAFGAGKSHVLYMLRSRSTEGASLAVDVTGFDSCGAIQIVASGATGAGGVSFVLRGPETANAPDAAAIRPENLRMLRVLDQIESRPDDKDENWWREFESSLKARKLRFSGE